MAFVDVTDATFDEALAGATVVVAHFTAPWCGPCATVERRLLEVVAAGGGRLTLVRLDIDAHPVVPSRHGVLSLPTVIVFEHGVEHARVVGAQPRRRYEEALASYWA
jgi:thioredoxin 1